MCEKHWQEARDYSADVGETRGCSTRTEARQMILWAKDLDKMRACR